MKTTVISCRTVEDEVRAAMQKSGVDYPIEWVDAGLHNTPERLTARLQELLDQQDADRVLMAMGFCGNSLKGLRVGDFELIVPKVDDCISLLLGGVERRMAVSRELAAYFFTEGWMRGERNIWVEYQYTVENYGEEMADTIMEMMYSHYRTIAVLDCGVGDAEKLTEQLEPLANALHLERTRVDATLGYLEGLFTGPWDDGRFMVLPRGYEIREEDLALAGGGSSLQ